MIESMESIQNNQCQLLYLYKHLPNSKAMDQIYFMEPSVTRFNTD